MLQFPGEGAQERRLIRRLTNAAKQYALHGEWERAVEANRKLLEYAPRDVAAYNRLGRALAALGQLDAAREAYEKALEIDPGNTIAQRNLNRLQWWNGDNGGSVALLQQPARADVFIEEVGRTYVTDVLEPADSAILAQLFPGQELLVEVRDNAVVVCDPVGRCLGRLDAELTRRLRDLIQQGNQYRAYVVALNGSTVRVILREVFRTASLLERPSFPPQPKIAAPRPYLPESGLQEEEELGEEEVAELLEETEEEEEEVVLSEEVTPEEELLVEDEPLLSDLDFTDDSPLDS